MRSSCAPFKLCKTSKHVGGKKEFLYNTFIVKKVYNGFTFENNILQKFITKS